MNGVKFHRISQMSRENLSQITGISIPTLRTMEQAINPGRICSANYRKVSSALGVSADELIRNDYPDFRKRAPYPSKTEHPSNCIAIYRLTKMLTFQQLAEHMKVTSRERARQVCAEEIPLQKHIATLAKRENISVTEFINRYSAQEGR